MMKKIHQVMISMLFLIAPFSFASGVMNQPVIEDMVQIGRGIHAISDGDSIRYMTENGRFILEGTIYDLWQQRLLTGYQDILSAVSTIDLSKLDFDLTALSPIKLGSGKRDVILFIDPYCPYCHQLLKEANTLIADYTFWVIALPLLGEKSINAVKSLNCQPSQQDALEQLLANDISLENANCDSIFHYGVIQKRMITAQIFGIASVPFIINHLGRIKQGMPESLAKWLKDTNE
ncbi:DsbC family protein [Thorsellia anophelis]|nr:DsbC family protein [Thorsellia anophelis]